MNAFSVALCLSDWVSISEVLRCGLTTEVHSHLIYFIPAACYRVILSDWSFLVADSLSDSEPGGGGSCL